MNEDPRAIATRLTELDDVTGVWAVAGRRLEAGDAAFVAGLGIAMWQRHGQDANPPWQYRSAFDHVLRLLALAPGRIDEALRLMAVTIDRRRARYAASLLASAHSADELTQVFRGPASDELRACVRQESILRSAEIGHPWNAPWHPLAWLPPALTPLEGRPGLPSYHVNGGSRDTPGLAVTPARRSGTAQPARATTTEAESTAIGTAVANWAEGSNGRIEARTFALDAELPPDALPATLVSLGLKSYHKPKSSPGPCSATQAWQQLFLAASGGGAYNDGDYGAYGRLFAWQSVAALVGAPPETPASEVEAMALASSWHWFAGTTKWFDDVAWDIGLAVVSPDRRRLAVLAATDTD
ncbi:DUF6183 family protein [Paractinoplanes atraurantiacus]|uniref:Uncharacterized protein n=1 Tax=Paractinoplanes atraurantiacus TaxID=1036182 RepID=A0A285KEZ6_9ACTN|nr:DUF6183 family protein [Actinoplanes atraurantiacus]SNY71168.1 hypothetical protein SAMN05421748_13941 [Actinoplanes atraurantiacus]